MKNSIFYIVFAIYAAAAFIISLLISYPIYSYYFLFSKKPDKSAYPLTRAWGKFLLRVFFIRLKLENKFIHQPNEAVIYIANHRSMLDIPVTAVLIPYHFRFLAKAELLKVPVLGRIIRGICITVKREDLNDKVTSYKRMVETLNKNSSVLIFPEGSRSNDTQTLGNFKNGAFKLQRETGRKLVTICLWETSRHFPATGEFILVPGKLQAKVEEINCKVFTTENELKEYCYSSMLNNLNEMKMRT